MDEICIDVKLIKGLRDDEINHIINRFGEMVETRHGGQYHHAELGQLEHIFEMDGAERRFSWHEDQFAPLLDADIGGALDEVSGNARRYCADSSHAARCNDHTHSAEGAAGNRRSDVGLMVVNHPV